MGSYVARRLLWVVALLFLVSLITFVVFYVFPSGDPAVLRAGTKANSATIAAVRKQMGLRDPVLVQYFHYMRNLVLHFDFGTSYFYNGTKVRTLIFERLPATFSLAVGAVVVWLLVSFPVGILSAVRQHGVFDRVATGISLVFLSMPPYFLGLVALYLFASDVGRWKLLPGQGSYVPISEDPGEWLTSLVMPWLVLAASFSAVYSRLLRANMVEALSADYIRTARAKGLRERSVVLRHGARSALTPVATVLGIDIGLLLGGAILTETVFNIPGVGRLSYDAIQNQDIPTIQGTVLFAAFFIIVCNLVVDVAYAFLDPRVRHA